MSTGIYERVNFAPNFGELLRPKKYADIFPSTCRRENTSMKNSTQPGSVKRVFCRFVRYTVDIVSTGSSSSPVLLFLVVDVDLGDFRGFTETRLMFAA